MTEFNDINLFEDSTLDERVRQLESIIRHTPVDSQSIAKDGIQSTNFQSGVKGYQILPNGDVEFNNGTFSGALSASTIDIGGADATSFHVDINGNMWSGAAAFADGIFKVSSAGILTM